jgi:hypothetical protein
MYIYENCCQMDNYRVPEHHGAARQQSWPVSDR